MLAGSILRGANHFSCVGSCITHGFKTMGELAPWPLAGLYLQANDLCYFLCILTAC